MGPTGRQRGAVDSMLAQDPKIPGSNPRFGGVEFHVSKMACKNPKQVPYSLIAWRFVLVALQTCGQFGHWPWLAIAAIQLALVSQ